MKKTRHGKLYYTHRLPFKFKRLFSQYHRISNRGNDLLIVKSPHFYQKDKHETVIVNLY